jgi:hypothetical protein
MATRDGRTLLAALTFVLSFLGANSRTEAGRVSKWAGGRGASRGGQVPPTGGTAPE